MANLPLLKDEKHSPPATSARHIVLSGQVQGVGFRPYVYQLALKHQLSGWVRNVVGHVELHVQGLSQNLDTFLNDIFDKTPPLAEPKLELNKQVDVEEFNTFSILKSTAQGEANISIPADLFLCDDCLAEMNNPQDRRYRYPFINCTQCGPRYTLIKSLPYDRKNTTMAGFDLCPACLAEYTDPGNRRFHAEPVACAVCGPTLTFHYGGEENTDNEIAIKRTVALLQQGKVVAVKGVGGYHLMCDAANTQAVSRLRSKKHRPDKPLAVMFPAPINKPFKYVERCFNLSDKDKSFLLQPARPILLVAKREPTELSELIAPGLNEVGMMLPYSPLHHLLLNDFSGPLVATSANITGEPVLIHKQEVENRLHHVADAFLHHNRPIQRPADDPLYRTIASQPRLVRIGRGTAPMELTLPFELEQPVLAVGAQMKNVIAMAWKKRVVISPHIGEMETKHSLEVFENTVEDLQKLYNVRAEHIICDAHPGYTTTRWANRQSLPVHPVYHHHAHASAAYYECKTDEAVIVFTWDGVAYGEDGTLWGGETFIGRPDKWQRVASMRPFNLPGGDRAGRQPWRSAAALCWAIGQTYDEIPEKDPLIQQAWQKNINAPQSTSAGRLFDAAAALTGVRTVASYEAQGPMELEALCEACDDYSELALEKTGNLLVTNWEQLIPEILNTNSSVATRAALFHSSLAHAIFHQAKTLRNKYAVNTISFSGGVFQNRVLTENAMALLQADGFNVYLPELLPVNDAGISFGQIIEYGFRR